MKLVVGLGNPGEKYAQTRHNVGWLVVNELARRAGASWRKDGEAEVCEVRLGAAPGGLLAGERVLLVKPQTFMNTSGKAVWPLTSFYKLGGESLLVVQDDLDSPFGLLRFRMGGRHGGQNGVRDIIARLGHDRFPRLKLGISRPPAGRDPADWVLSKWREEERETLTELVRLGADAAQRWAVQGLPEAQQAYNSTDLRPKPPSPLPPSPSSPSPSSTPPSSTSPSPAKANPEPGDVQD